MATIQECRRISEQVSNIFDRGLAITVDTLFFAESTYGIAPYDLEETLTDEAFEDSETLLKLIFFPDHSVRCMMEPLLDGATFKPQDEAIIVRQVVQHNSRVKLLFPDFEHNFTLGRTADVTEVFVKKLYICRALGADIRSALDENLPKGTAICAKVHLRCRNYGFSEKIRQALCVFIKNAALMEGTFQELFELTLVLLSQVPECTAIGDYFLEQRLLQEKTLKDIKEFERKKDHYGMEYLMMQKYPVPHESEEMVASRLQMLNTIIDDILQFLPSSKGYVGQRDLGVFDSEHDMETLFRILS